MAWIAVHEEVLGGKLRGFRKRIKCSQAEALGILTYLWLWARNNADISGLLVNTDFEDLEEAIKPVLCESLHSNVVVDALIKEGWIDEHEGQYYVHDWYDWQKFWYNYLDRKEKDKLRKQAERANSLAQKKPSIASQNSDPVNEKKKSEKPKKPPKIQYAESVNMYEQDHQKLVDKFGEQFTEKLIERLDNYKGASGKKYKDDYRAILAWVVEDCQKKYPQLVKKQSSSVPPGENPFSAYIGG